MTNIRYVPASNSPSALGPARGLENVIISARAGLDNWITLWGKCFERLYLSSDEKVDSATAYWQEVEAVKICQKPVKYARNR